MTDRKKASSRAPGRPPDPAKVEAILEASWRLFLAYGVEAVTIDRIAAEARVAKMTVYAHFADKRALFRAGVLRETERIETAQQQGIAVDTGGSLRDALIAFGCELLFFLITPGAVDFYGTLSGDLRRDPDLGRTFYDAGPGRTLSNLTALLAGPLAGDLAIDDPAQAAELLFGMWQGASNFRLMLGVEQAGVDPGIEHHVVHCVDRFLAAYAA
ncbi:TetR/AcrR family transcriptional regulator [Sphingomonas sp. GlSt437]|uniref:TetR/AcrR family transcriptional regulator n=1 Tax=Sphingomonas sp. GlSt437 TaxID=3389970 RepID=UPI003A838D6D